MKNTIAILALLASTSCLDLTSNKGGHQEEFVPAAQTVPIPPEGWDSEEFVPVSLDNYTQDELQAATMQVDEGAHFERYYTPGEAVYDEPAEGEIGKLEQGLFFESFQLYLPDGFGAEVATSRGCNMFHGPTCALPARTTVSIRTCTPSSYDHNWQVALNDAAWQLFFEVNSIPGVRFEITDVDENNCNNPHVPEVIFLTYGSVPGPALGQADGGAIFAPPWYDFVVNNDNTITVDDGKTWDFHQEFGAENGWFGYFFLLKNVIFHEGMHGLGWGHPTGTPPPQQFPDVMRGANAITWTTGWISMGGWREDVMTLFRWHN